MQRDIELVEARERILLARIAELEDALSVAIDLAEFWIDRDKSSRMSETEYSAWLNLGHRSNSMRIAYAARGRV